MPKDEDEDTATIKVKAVGGGVETFDDATFEVDGNFFMVDDGDGTVHMWPANSIEKVTIKDNVEDEDGDDD